MDITFDKILIYSKGPTIMAHFLTSLFDVEVFKVADDLYDFKLGGSPFRILKSESSDLHLIPHSLFLFVQTQKLQLTNPYLFRPVRPTVLDQLFEAQLYRR